MNIEGYSVGREVVVLGSGDIGLIMARRMTLEGAKVKVVAELMPYSGGLEAEHCPVSGRLRHPAEAQPHGGGYPGQGAGDRRYARQGGPDTEAHPRNTRVNYSCDTLLLSVGLIPENELSRGIGVEMSRVTSGPNVSDKLETSAEGIFACGNVLHVHDLVDYVSEEATLAGTNAAAYVRAESGMAGGHRVVMKAENGVRYTVPQSLDVDCMADQVTVRFRVADVYKGRFISVYYDDKRVVHRKKQVLAPGEMEQVVIKKESLKDYPDIKEIVICTEVE